jgi:hypothetical protein
MGPRGCRCTHTGSPLAWFARRLRWEGYGDKLRESVNGVLTDGPPDTDALRRATRWHKLI